MSDKEILTKAIEKAITNGWGTAFEQEFFKHWDIDSDEAPYYLRSFSPGLQNLRYESIILKPRFAQAFWGEGEKQENSFLGGTTWVFDGKRAAKCRWQFHLMQMVLEDSPLRYLAQFLN